MKIIGTTFLKNSKGSIMDGLEIISFSLQYFLVDVKPYLVSNLELMINLVFIMQRFILFLNFLQLFPNCLMYLLDPLDEIAGSIFIYFFI